MASMKMKAVHGWSLTQNMVKAMKDRLINMFVRLIQLDMRNYVVDRRKKYDILNGIVRKRGKYDNNNNRRRAIGEKRQQ